ncbi:MAG: hypothetical protein ACFB15_06380 [Cyclobacteriaceae bacterium]
MVLIQVILPWWVLPGAIDLSSSRIAKMALEDDPQLLEALSMVVTAKIRIIFDGADNS